MTPLMSPSEFAADALVRAYLHGRTLPKILHGAVVWVAETRLRSGKRPVLDATLCADIDSQAIAPRHPAPLFAATVIAVAEGA
ncbi:hypothetical protein [Variovorax sp. PAMC26660]|uniref:hypothetical protein n=1 Tax=Variovorax sp. PAMC26660 TaxID=2762322 RepID=UPI00164DA7D4|nr:hypothetical protein [Variovorax sp. PAMC26660]QNK69678.1 hypothetical protein H7F35_08280 [Variovorax sp. PAMC26660]